MVGSIPAVRIAAISSRSAISNLRNCIPGSQPSIAERGLAPLINHLILRDYEPDLSDEETAALARLLRDVATAFRRSLFSRGLALQGADTFISIT
jgi:hypothetical protein